MWLTAESINDLCINRTYCEKHLLPYSDFGKGKIPQDSRASESEEKRLLCTIFLNSKDNSNFASNPEHNSEHRRFRHHKDESYSKTSILCGILLLRLIINKLLLCDIWLFNPVNRKIICGSTFNSQGKFKLLFASWSDLFPKFSPKTSLNH